MLAEKSFLETAPQAGLNATEAVWQRIRQHLEAEKTRIFQEIRQYPPPIPACDVQFNSLLAERVNILQELGHVEAILKQPLTGKETIGLLDEFILKSSCVNGDLKRSIRQSLSIGHTI